MSSTEEILTQAFQHHQAGNLAEAERVYRQVLNLNPREANALYLLGMLTHQVGQHQAALDLIRRALSIAPQTAQFHLLLGNVYADLGRREEAVLGYRQALRLQPDLPNAHNNLGVALAEQGQIVDAMECYRQALRLSPDFPEAYNNIGNLLARQLKWEEAAAAYRQAIALRPNYAGVHNNLATALIQQGRPEEAAGSCCKALLLRPDFPEAHFNLGLILQQCGYPTEAIDHYEQALRLRPNFAQTHNNLGNALKDQGRMVEAMACYQKAVDLDPAFIDAKSNLLYSLVFCPEYDAARIYEKCRLWNEHHAVPLAKFIRPHGNDPSPGRRLRVGYVSANFRGHAETFFTVPLLAAHDHQSFEVLCYAAVARPDDFTARLRSHADVWRDIDRLTYEQVADLVRADEIDILVDLTLHMGPRTFMQVFARKPAPVQVCWLAYQGTTGLDAMDYRLTDPHIDPPGLDDRYYSEESIRLPVSFWCYDPLESGPEVNALPALTRDHVTFGCLNNFCKVNAQVLKLWARVLQAVERSRLLLLTAEGPHRGRALDVMEEEGVARERVTFVPIQPRLDYLELYRTIDLALDTIPYNGQTTSLDAFWMGIPVVTILGRTGAGRSGASLLRNLGLPELIASSPDDFVRIAAELAGDLPRLSRLRGTLREKLQQSPLMDANRFARDVEGAYRVMWERWCAKVGRRGPKGR